MKTRTLIVLALIAVILVLTFSYMVIEVDLPIR